MQNTSPVFNNPTIQLSYRELRYLEHVLENYRFFGTLGMAHMGGGGGRLVCVIMTHCVRKSICNSPLMKIFISLGCLICTSRNIKTCYKLMQGCV